jgi:predicted N-formylglutamate amidohydrolase
LSAEDHDIAVIERAGAAPVLIVCEHASNRFPERWGDLGLTEAGREGHIAWDPGALPLARALAARLGAALIHATVSRLIYDLNRPPEAPDAMPAVSEIHEIPGNRDLSDEERAARVAEVHDPWHRALSDTIDAVAPKAMVTIHSFTPVYRGQRRAVEVGILHDSDTRLADAMLKAGPPGWRRNEPYGPEDGVTHTLAHVAQPRGILPVMIEVRNDLLADEAGVARICNDLTAALKKAFVTTGIAATREFP